MNLLMICKVVKFTEIFVSILEDHETETFQISHEYCLKYTILQSCMYMNSQINKWRTKWHSQCMSDIGSLKPWFDIYVAWIFVWFQNVCFRLQALEKRVFIENGELPRSVGDIQSQVEEFKNKLQVGRHKRYYIRCQK